MLTKSQKEKILGSIEYGKPIRVFIGDRPRPAKRHYNIVYCQYPGCDKQILATITYIKGVESLITTDRLNDKKFCDECRNKRKVEIMAEGKKLLKPAVDETEFGFIPTSKPTAKNADAMARLLIGL